MKRVSLIVLGLVIGLVLGYAGRDLPFGNQKSPENNTQPSDATVFSPPVAGTGSASEVSSATAAMGGEPALPDFPGYRRLIEYVLPERCLAQACIGVADIRDGSGEENLSGFFSHQVIRNIFVRISEGVNPSFGPFVNALSANADKIHFFLMPPPGDMPAPGLVIVCEWPDISLGDVRKALRDPIAADLPDGVTYSESVAGFSLEGVRAANGNVSYVVVKNAVWVSNSRQILAGLFSTELPPPLQGQSPLDSLLDKVPSDTFAAVLNLEPQPDGSTGPAGPLAVLAGMGIDRVALGLGGEPPSLVTFGRFKEPPPWVSGWSPLDASDLHASRAGLLATVRISLPSSVGRRFSSGMPDMASSGEGGGQVPSFERFPKEQREALRRRWSERRGSFRGPRRGGRSQWRVVAATRFLPPARTLCIRIAPGELEPIVWSVVFEGNEKGLADWCRNLEDSPWCKVEEGGGDVRRLTFQGGPILMTWGVEQLLVSQKGQELIVYSSEESSRLLAEPEGSAGKIIMERSKSQPAELPQVYAEISADLFHLLILGEKESLDRRSPNSAMVANLLDVLAGFTSPVEFDLAILPDGVRARVKADHQVGAVLGPVLVASAFLRGGI